MSKPIYVLSGPNLNLLGTREPEIYGHQTLEDVQRLCETRASALGCTVVFRQSNHEGVLIDWIHEAHAKQAAGIIINAAGFTTTSISIMDALLAVKLPVIEIHMTNIHQRESFRHNSYMSKAAKGMICGFGVDSYTLAIVGLAGIVGAKE